MQPAVVMVTNAARVAGDRGRTSEELEGTGLAAVVSGKLKDAIVYRRTRERDRMAGGRGGLRGHDDANRTDERYLSRSPSETVWRRPRMAQPTRSNAF